MTATASTATTKSKAEVAKLEAETKAYLAEARYHSLQADRLKRLKAMEDSELKAQRTLDFTSEVSFGTVRAAINQVSQWRTVDANSPIVVRLLTPGGDAIAGLAFYDWMRLAVASGTPIVTVAVGMAASMGAVLLQGGSTRLVTPSTYVMVHEVETALAGKLADIIEEAKFSARVQDRLLDILAERSSLTKTAIKRKWTKGDWWLDAEETVKVGFADQVAVSYTW